MQFNDNREKKAADQKLSSLRNELYILRDKLRDLNHVLTHISQVNPQSAVSRKARDTTSCLSVLDEGLNFILTNNYTDWIQADLDGTRKTLSFLAFSSLSPDMLDDVSTQLGQIHQNLDVEAGQGDGLDEATTPSMIYMHQVAFLTEGGQLDEIESTAEFLKSLLMPESDKVEL